MAFNGIKTKKMEKKTQITRIVQGNTIELRYLIATSNTVNPSTHIHTSSV